MKKIILSLLIVLVIIAIVFVGVGLVRQKTYKPQNPIATIQIEGYDKPIKVELDPQSAPNAVANFIKLANNGFYTNFKMHIEEDRILGDESMEMATLSNIMEYPEKDYVYGIKGDFVVNGFDNLLKHKKGVITMERDDYSYFGYTEEGYNSANCNFAILTQDLEKYNGYYASFGKVIEGMDVLEAIAATRVEETKEETDATKEENTENAETTDTTEETTEEKNVNIITITSVSVDTFGIDYGMPQVVNYEETMEKVNQIYNQYFGGDSSSVVVE